MDNFIERAEAEARKNTKYDYGQQYAFLRGAQFGRTITKSELEAAAKALYERLCLVTTWEHLSEVSKQEYRQQADTALRAIHCTFTDEAQP